MLADFAALETENNYDADNEYGFQDLPEDCVAELPADLREFLLPRGGEVYSHPFATAVSESGRYVYVADAGANAVWTVDTWDDDVDATVLDPVPTLATAELRDSLAAQGIALPECVLGYTFNSEPVPTDIELGPDGLLYLTSLPGIPEDPTLGSVRSFDPDSGDIEIVVSGLTSPTGLAFDRYGNLFVTELFANRISIVPAGSDEAELFTDATQPHGRRGQGRVPVLHPERPAGRGRTERHAGAHAPGLRRGLREGLARKDQRYRRRRRIPVGVRRRRAAGRCEQAGPAPTPSMRAARHTPARSAGEASAHTRQCSCMAACPEHSSPQILHAVRQASRTERVSSAA